MSYVWISHLQHFKPFIPQQAFTDSRPKILQQFTFYSQTKYFAILVVQLLDIAFPGAHTFLELFPSSQGILS